MPYEGGYGGYAPDQLGGVIDTSGGGLDPGFAWSTAPGGQFPGGEYFANELATALGLTPEQFTQRMAANPQYKNILEGLHGTGITGGIGGLARMFGSNIRNSSGVGGVSDNYGIADNNMFSGPGGAYGPFSGPTRGLADQNVAPNGMADFPDFGQFGSQPNNGSSATTPGKHHGGGDAVTPHGLPVYPGVNYTPSFLGWQPVDVWAGQQLNQHPTFVGGGQLPQAPGGLPLAPAGGGKKPKKGGGLGGKPPVPMGNGKGGGVLTGLGGGGGATKPPGGTAGSDQQQFTPEQLKTLLGLMQGATGADPNTAMGVLGSIGRHLGPGLGQMAGTQTGFNTSDLFGNTRGAFDDPTAGVRNTAGMPNQTPISPALFATLFGETGLGGEAAYRDFMMSQGMSKPEVDSLLGAAPSSSVVRGPGGYQFEQNAGEPIAWGGSGASPGAGMSGVGSGGGAFSSLGDLDRTGSGYIFKI
jgi:hypothetical protein